MNRQPRGAQGRGKGLDLSAHGTFSRSGEPCSRTDSISLCKMAVGPGPRPPPPASSFTVPEWLP